MNIETLYQKYLQCNAVSTDTRKITPDSLFFALKGGNFNGNTFAADAISKGAKFAVVDEDQYALNDRYILVDNALKALQELARYHRQQLSVPIIAMTGSNGKTTTKELIQRVLAKKYSVYATQGNLNNYIGLPLTLLSIPKDTEIVVLEMGSNQIGDINELTTICEPTHGLITNIGKAHLEGFGGLEGVKQGEGELYDYFKTHSGTIFANSQNTILQEMLANRSLQAVMYPSADDFLHCQLLEFAPNVVYQDEDGEIVRTHLPGKHNFENIAAALCIGKYFGVPLPLANEAISGYISQNNRSQVLQKGSNTILLDAYNANPTSMQASLEYFAALKADHKIVILGDMAELGEESAQEHLHIGEVAGKGKFDKILLCGKLMQNAIVGAPDAYYFIDKFSLNNWLMDYKFENTHFLIKGSRSMAMETVVQFL
ncbi:UDP-N-acetylmuramoyl-tripeptide--D-alanyl-D-alanine ligase [Xanthocytophaga agilis]|uniref:UDP-N-acetylmuramoyl-tripeptide--D-alanyl-D-alanine ligase n=1 Tax=Xanthocytophaga agilis TaxID=3048010 RepID=A0AAE3R3B2_9BACT|nr:UDP-N-acetylmuramoyl-tripeptide--D-alanyl-D-alanine ligase [Xanthocytophaga agilis]MDJ1502370.1 UDP-N-acetylmuramoyl-tripeptide--D-alanyl-D-alanine ligase [Xanthocytophaga agilis]